VFRLLICDDHPAIRVGLRATAKAAIPQCEVTEVDSGAALLQQLSGPQPFDLLILDVNLPDRTGLDLLADVRGLRPQLHVWVTSGEPNEQWMAQALNGGANGYLPKSVDESVLSQALRDASQGRIILPANYAQRPATRWDPERARTGAEQVLARLGLTPRQRDVLTCILRGQSNKQIARALDISDGTVKTHTAAIFNALGVNSRANVIVKCSSLGIPLGGH
jgi:DNA-binding NarL/FixJ family response regulator